MSRHSILVAILAIFIGVHGASAQTSRNPFLSPGANTPMQEPSFPAIPNSPAQPMPTLDLGGTVAGIQEFYDTAYAIEADFTQESTIKSINKVQSARGKVYFKKAGKMAWLYEMPTQQKIISDGLWLWMYLPDNHQVIKNRTNQAFSTDTPNNFLSGLGDIKRDFHVRFDSPHYDDQRNVRLVFEPRGQQSWTSLSATARQAVDASGRPRLGRNGKPMFMIVATTLKDRFNNLNKITFYNLRAYGQNDAFKVPDSVFMFSPPAGVQIIEPPGALRAR